MKTNISISISVLFFTFNVFSQQIENGFAPSIPDFNVQMGSGVYNANKPIGTIPDLSYLGGYQHLIVARHPNPNNNFQLQIASSMSENDKLYFRKLASPTATSASSNWNELATRGSNSFIGSQSISGNLIIGNDSEIATISGPTYGGAIQFKDNAGYGGSLNRFLRIGWKDNNAVFSPVISINDDLNVGIGTTNPDSKLTVAGNIHAQEVKVTVNAGAVPDYVFENDYKLKSLKEVEEYINQNNHLPEIPSAQEIEKNGLMLAEMNLNLLKKIEEMTLYMIDQNKQIIDLKTRLENVELKVK